MNEVGNAKKMKSKSECKEEDLYDFIDLSLDLKAKSLFFELTAELKNFKKEEAKG